MKDDQPLFGEQGDAFNRYREFLSADLHATGFVTAKWYVNAVKVAAQILDHQGALEKFAAEKTKEPKDLEEHLGFEL